MKPKIYVANNNAELIENVRTYLAERLNYLLEQNGTIGIGVSGGSMPKIFTEAILSIPNLNWKRIRIFMVDERNVDVSNPDSNQAEYTRLFPEELKDVIVPVPIFEKDLRRTAQAYELNLRKYLLPELYNNVPRFDLLFLGVGPDGHTASIFPGKERLEKITDMNWVSALDDSPKPPPSRVTLTLNTINHAKNVSFIIQGEGKAEVVRGILHKDQKYPSSYVRPINDKLVFFLDKGSASTISLDLDDVGSTPEPESPPPSFEE
uniref:6-phosphogluconolactonase n=1 Tax=Caenorhabditis japonica TaxID=281687 RepID=A0A8R1HJ97_CAEJA